MIRMGSLDGWMIGWKGTGDRGLESGVGDLRANGKGTG